MRCLGAYFFVVVAITFPVSAFTEGICDVSRVVQPGVAIGKIKIGMDVSEAVALLGAPKIEKKATAKGAEWRHLYYLTNEPSSDAAIDTRDSKIVSIALGSGTTDTANCATEEGIHIGQHTLKIAKATLGQPDRRFGNSSLGWWVYDRHGLRVFTTEKDVIAIEIFAPGTNCDLAQPLIALGWHRKE